MPSQCCVHDKQQTESSSHRGNIRGNIHRVPSVQSEEG
jgi:hypothetical protein